MTWNKLSSPKIEYGKTSIHVDDETLPLSNTTEDSVVVSSLGLKKFRSMLWKEGNRKGFQVFHLPQKQENRGNSSMLRKDAELQELLLKFEKVFKDALPPGLPPKRAVNHAIEIDEDVKTTTTTIDPAVSCGTRGRKGVCRRRTQEGKDTPQKVAFWGLAVIGEEKGQIKCCGGLPGIKSPHKIEQLPAAPF